jgi:hypothetical protein
MRSRRPAVREQRRLRRADGSTERQQCLRQAYGESDPTDDVCHILTGLRRTPGSRSAGDPCSYKDGYHGLAVPGSQGWPPERPMSTGMTFPGPGGLSGRRRAGMPI